jgi:hypothetical protein
MSDRTLDVVPIKAAVNGQRRSESFHFRQARLLEASTQEIFGNLRFRPLLAGGTMGRTRLHQAEISRPVKMIGREPDRISASAAYDTGIREPRS